MFDMIFTHKHILFPFYTQWKRGRCASVSLSQLLLTQFILFIRLRTRISSPFFNKINFPQSVLQKTCKSSPCHSYADVSNCEIRIENWKRPRNEPRETRRSVVSYSLGSLGKHFWSANWIVFLKLWHWVIVIVFPIEYIERFQRKESRAWRPKLAEDRIFVQIRDPFTKISTVCHSNVEKGYTDLHTDNKLFTANQCVHIQTHTVWRRKKAKDLRVLTHYTVLSARKVNFRKILLCVKCVRAHALTLSRSRISK